VARALALAAPASAHDFWIEPARFESDVGTAIPLRLLIGHGTDREEYPRTDKHLVRFTARGPGGESDVPGVSGVSPAGFLRPTKAGLHVVAYRSRATRHRMEAAAFETYLAEEGLDEAVRLRRERGHSALPGREAFSRCAKALLAVGGSAEGAFDAKADLELEIVPESNPFLLVPPAEVPVRVLWKAAPLAKARVAAYRLDEPDAVVSARTDAEGRARLRLAEPGRWLVKCVHLFEAKDDPEADWESLWASLTFAVRAPPSVPK
jgi:uncharacterized GH25 family protein